MKETKNTGITQQHREALSYLLSFYERHLWHFTVPSVRRNRHIAEVQLLQLKIQLLPLPKIETLTSDEVGHIDVAISVFITQIREKIPQSPSRDEVLASCEDLREYLTGSLSTSQKE